MAFRRLFSQEVAQMLQITTGTTKSNLARARAILKEK
jgi:DNA-directed RNA polymerase specialized sigma24 family protein